MRLDKREEYTPGWKFSEWEMNGVPLRIEIGPKDIKEKQVIAVRRDTGKKEAISLASLNKKLLEILKDIQRSMFEEALKFQNENTHEVQNFKDFKAILKRIICSNNNSIVSKFKIKKEYYIIPITIINHFRKSLNSPVSTLNFKLIGDIK